MSSLTPCRFYAQGTCRYGNSCRFYHEPRGQAGFFGNRTLAPATFQPQGGLNQGQAALNLTAKSNQNLDTLVEVVKKDMQEWQNSKIWPYSSYGPVGGKPCMPGFEDLSPEELRMTFMQCGNNLPQEILIRFQQIQQLRMNYQQPTMENRNIIERIATSSTTGATPVSPFGGQPGGTPLQQGSIFGGTGTSTQQSGSIFGGGSATTPQQQPAAGSIFGGSTFGGSPSTFGQQSGANFFQTPSVQQAPAPTTGGIFGAQPAQSIFGQAASPPQSTGLFQQPPQQTSLFQPQGQAAQAIPPGSFFQQQTKPQGSLFQQPQLTPASNLPQMQGGLFHTPQQQGQQPTTGLFQLQQNQAPQSQPVQSGGSIFGGGQQQSAVFGQTSGNVFGGNAVQQSTGSGGNIFGGGGPQQGSTTPGNIFGGAAPGFGGSQQQPVSAINQQFVYSQESELSPEDLEAFKSSEFTIDSLPLTLPPMSLCL